jgi:hypothetical protein
LARSDIREHALALDGLLQNRGQIGPHPAQGVGADRFDARLLDGLEDRLALRRGRAAPGVGGGIMVGQTQGHLVGHAADARGLLGRQVAGRMGQDGAVADQRGPVAGEHDLQVRRLGKRSRGVRQGALEGLGRAFGLVGHGTVLTRRRQGMEGGGDQWSSHCRMKPT